MSESFSLQEQLKFTSVVVPPERGPVLDDSLPWTAIYIAIALCCFAVLVICCFKRRHRMVSKQFGRIVPPSGTAMKGANHDPSPIELFTSTGSAQLQKLNQKLRKKQMKTRLLTPDDGFDHDSTAP